MGATDIARTFATARAAAEGFAHFPGALPQTLNDAYAIQAEAIERWQQAIGGWKVGRIAADLTASLGADRFIGPIFAPDIVDAGSGFPAIPGGFAAFEAELAIVAADDAPPNKRNWSIGEALALVGTAHIAVEIAGSPLATINDLGPLATIAGFGNNLGLIVGAEIPDADDLDAIGCTSTIDGRIAAQATAAILPGGPLTAFAFALGEAARIGFPIRGGQIISTGAITGILPVAIGQNCTADFGKHGRIDCTVVAAGDGEREAA